MREDGVSCEGGGSLGDSSWGEVQCSMEDLVRLFMEKWIKYPLRWDKCVRLPSEEGQSKLFLQHLNILLIYSV